MMRIRFSDDRKVFNMHKDGIPYLSFDMLDRLGVPNLFTTRFTDFDPDAGKGTEGLRVAVMNDEDEEEASKVVRGYRDILARQLGSSLERECITDQKHTNYVHVASSEDLGLSRKPLHMQSVDGVVTDIPDVLMTVFGADCPSIYIVDPVRKASGLVHAGWRGTLGRIPAVAIANMVVRFGCDPSDMYVAIGPGICKDCYEMGDEVYDAFASEWSVREADAILSRYPGGKYHLDLREANRLTLLGSGIPSGHIEISNICTKCNADTFYSYRAHRMENEQAAMLVNRFDR